MIQAIGKTDTVKDRKELLKSIQPISAFLGDFKTHSSKKAYILGAQSKIQIINPEASFLGLYKACKFLEQLNEQKRRPLRVLFLNSNPEFSKIIKHNAHFCQQFYINTKWVGGTLTNWKQVSQSIQAFSFFQSKWEWVLKTQDIKFPRLEKFRKCFIGFLTKNQEVSQFFSLSTMRMKLQLLNFEKTKERFSISNTHISKKIASFSNEKPDILVIIDPSSQQVAINEAYSENIPVIAFVNSDADIEAVTYPIIGNNQNTFFLAFCVGWIARVLKSF